MSKPQKERIFRMKQFVVNHSISANKVGVDGVLVGAWAPVMKGSIRILDAGCGCGLISLMLAQRMPEARITGVDIEMGAVKEARENVTSSKWSDRVEILFKDFGEIKEQYDLIVSNPPFFHSGVEASESSRTLARHAGSLSPERLIISKERLKEGGSLVLIASAESEQSLILLGESTGLVLKRLTRVKGNPRVTPKRILMEWKKDLDRNNVPEIEELTIEVSRGQYTKEYIVLCKDFYVKF